MKTAPVVAVAAAVTAIALGVVASRGPNPPCVARQLGEPAEICRRRVGDHIAVVDQLVPFSASEAVGWCQPVDCGLKYRRPPYVGPKAPITQPPSQ